MKQLTGAQTGGGVNMYNIDGQLGSDTDETKPEQYIYPTKEAAAAAKAEAALTSGGRRRRHSKGHKGNSWLAHVKATMKLHPGKSFKQVLKIAKKTYKRSQSQSQSGGRKRKGSKGKGTRRGQYGGSGGKVAGVGESASPYV